MDAQGASTAILERGCSSNFGLFKKYGGNGFYVDAFRRSSVKFTSMDGLDNGIMAKAPISLIDCGLRFTMSSSKVSGILA